MVYLFFFSSNIVPIFRLLYNPFVKDIKDQYLSIYRLLLFLLAVMIPLFGLAFAYGNPEAVSPPLFKEILAPVGIFILIASFKFSWVKRNMQSIMLVLYVVVVIWQLFVLKMNKFNPNNDMGFLVVISAITVGFESRKIFIAFISILFVLMTSFVLVNDVEGISKLIFIITVFSVLFISFLVNNRKFKAESSVGEFTAQLKGKNKEITDSISYGKRIQNAILPNTGLVNKYFPDSFVLYKPKDIVAGDFYWMEKVGDHILFAVADCTGHGVPGAMVSVVCNGALNRAIREFRLTTPAAILDKTTDLVIEAFSQSDDMVKDGMDISLCSWNLRTGEFWFSGANNSIYLVKGKEKKIETFIADKQPIGQFDKRRPFTNVKVDFEKNDTLYLFTDGMVDQFGGPKGKKFKHKKFKELLLSISHRTSKEKKSDINSVFEEWRGEMEQVDDVCIVGINL